jgi:hypothetical protein
MGGGGYTGQLLMVWCVETNKSGNSGMGFLFSSGWPWIFYIDGQKLI